MCRRKQEILASPTVQEGEEEEEEEDDEAAGVDVQKETLQDRVDSALGSTDGGFIRRVLDEAAAAGHAHPSLKILKEKHAVLLQGLGVVAS